LEVLEGRVVLSTFTVNSLGDAGSGSNNSGDLRYCINRANADNQANQIVFDSTVFGTPQTITLSGSQLELSDTGGTQTITGPAALVTISASEQSSVFQVGGGVTASISGLAFSDYGSGSEYSNGVVLSNSGVLTLDHCTISGSSASFNYASGLYNRGTMNLTDCTVSGGASQANGGGVSNSGTANLTGCTISGSSAVIARGGGVYNSHTGNLTLTDCTVSGNSAFNGGGVFNAGTANLTGCTVSGSSAAAGAGGFANLRNSGGGVYNRGTASLTNCTISGNSATGSHGFGGGVYNYGPTGNLTLTACTISGNSAPFGGGLYNPGGDYGGTADLTDMIVAGNTSSSGPNDIGGSVSDGIHNLVGAGGSGGLANGVDGNIVLTSFTDLGLAPLGNNSGPTQTMALLAGSPAIGAGVIADYPGTTTPITTDQRGEPFDSPHPDIGAFQSQGSTLISLTFSGISHQSIAYGTSSVTLSGTLANGSQAPEGEHVAVTLDGVEQSAAVGSGGAFSTTFLSTGLSVAGSPYTVTYAYTSDGTFASAATSSSLTVNPAGTTTGLSASPTTATAGQSVTLTATITVVAPGSGAPTGSVQFFVGSTSLGTATLSGKTATLATTTLPVGTDSLTARYLGEPDFATSTSNAVSVTIKAAGIATTTALTSSPNPSVFGQPVTLTATVKPSSGTGTPTGTVTFYAGSTPLGSATLSNKKATLRTTAIPVGSQAISAAYSGNASDAPSSSLILEQTVNPDSTTTNVSSSDATSVYAQAVTFTATVEAEAPGSGTPTGTVTFRNGTTTLGTATLEGGRASFTIKTLPIGSDAITVVYGGDANFSTSTSAVLKQTVRQAARSSPAVAMGPSVVDQVLAVVQEKRAQEVLIGDLAFEQLSSTKPWRK
jgi:hypothetical protein